VAHLIALRIDNPESVELGLLRCREMRVREGGDPAEYDAAIELLHASCATWYQSERPDLERLRAAYAAAEVDAADLVGAA